MSNSPEGRIASSDRGDPPAAVLAFAFDARIPFSYFSSSLFHSTLPSLFAARHSLFAIRLFFAFRCPFARGVRSAGGASDACDAPRSARHDRRADASSIRKPEQSPPCVHCAPQVAPGCVRYAAKPSREAHSAVRRLAFPATGNARLYGAPRGISGPGPCSPLSRLR